MNVKYGVFTSGTKEWVEICQAAAPFEITVMRLEHGNATVLRLFADAGSSSWHKDAHIDDSVMLRANPLRDILLSVEAAKEQLSEYLHEELGDYSFARFWMIRHLHIDVAKGKKIPGFAWTRFSKAHPGMKALRESFGLVDKDTDVATVTAPKKRKVAVVKPEIKKPPRKPKCPIHTQEMQFEVLRGVWECTVDGCKQIALPKRERIEGTLLLGKGDVSIRVVYPDKGESPLVCLISDDNVALDITELLQLSVQDVIDLGDIDEKIDAGKRAAVEEIRVKNISFVIEGPATIMGIENAP